MLTAVVVVGRFILCVVSDRSINCRWARGMLTGDADAGAEAEGRHGHHDELAGAGELGARDGCMQMNRQDVYVDRTIHHSQPPQHQAVFVGVPLPGTGAWTGAALAALFKLSYAESLLGIVAGIVSAGGIMTAVVLAGACGGQ